MISMFARDKNATVDRKIDFLSLFSPKKRERMNFISVQFAI